MSGFIHFIVAGLKKPLQVSTIFPTGERVAMRLTEPLGQNNDGYVVELGVGSGAITQFILGRMADPSKYIGFEINRDLYAYLRKKFPQLKIVDDSAVNIKTHLGDNQAKAIVSTLPWTLLPGEIAEEIIDAVWSSLPTGGTFSTYMALNVLWTPAASKIQTLLYSKFSKVDARIEFGNVPPARVFICYKG